MHKYSTVISGFIFTCIVFVLYLHYGSLSEFRYYYRPEQIEIRKNQAILRPMYSQLQRELVKSKLNLPFALDNLDLIINFASIHSKLGDGVLPESVRQLLEGVLCTAPGQVTALNLLAIDAYKHDKLALAVKYWRQILALVSPEQDQSEHVLILQNKVVETEEKLAQFESVQTKT